METPRLPTIPIPPSKEIKLSPRPIMAKVYDQLAERGQSRGGRAAGPEQADSMELSPQGRAYTYARELVQKTLGRLASNLKGQNEQFRLAGSEAFQEKFEAHSDFSPDGTANLILSGVTGYIYGAYRMQNPDMTEEELEHFHAEATRGVRQGFEEAKGYLDAIDLFQGEVAENAKSTVDKVLTGLDSFVEAERERLFSEPADA